MAYWHTSAVKDSLSGSQTGGGWQESLVNKAWGFKCHPSMHNWKDVGVCRIQNTLWYVAMNATYWQFCYEHARSTTNQMLAIYKTGWPLMWGKWAPQVSSRIATESATQKCWQWCRKISISLDYFLSRHFISTPQNSSHRRDIIIIKYHLCVEWVCRLVPLFCNIGLYWTIRLKILTLHIHELIHKAIIYIVHYIHNGFYLTNTLACGNERSNYVRVLKSEINWQLHLRKHVY